MEKELNFEVPAGYVIDNEKSTPEKIVFKKIGKPKTWEEYCGLVHGRPSFYSDCKNRIIYSSYTGAFNEFLTNKRAEQFMAIGKLLQLRDYWVQDLGKCEVALCGNGMDGIITCSCDENHYDLLTFPTKEMAEEFVECFPDLIKQAFSLV